MKFEVTTFRRGLPTSVVPERDEFEFNPDQPRGEDGKWIESGGGDRGGGGTPPNPELQEIKGLKTPRGRKEYFDPDEEKIAQDAAGRYAQLKTRWAELDREMLPYAGQPDNPESVRIISEQLEVYKEMHALNLDEGNKEGVGMPGGPRDVVVVGAGPAGLQAAINGGTEGLDTLMVDANPIPGGQIALSSRVENVLGFPAGISGQELAQDGLLQAQRVGAETKLGVGVTGLSYNPETGMKTLTFSDGSMEEARAVVIAGGVQFNTLSFPGADSKSVVYGDSNQIKALARGGEAAIVGGGNSAGQAALYVAPTADKVTMLVRGDSLTESMSPYLIDQLESDPHIAIRYNSEIAAAEKTPSGTLESISLRDGTVLPTDTVGVFVGSSPRTDWAGVERDERGFITTGGKGSSSPLETSIPGVYAAGDVRSGSQHRVVTAAGEGGLAVANAWQYVNNKFGQPGVGKAAVTVTTFKQDKHPDAGDPALKFLKKVQDLDRQEPYTGFDAHADVPTMTAAGLPSIVEQIREVAADHQPDEVAYGQTAWNPSSRTVFWVDWDGTSVEERDAAEAAFLAIDGVEKFEGCAECALPEGDGWEIVYPVDEEAQLQEIVTLATERLELGEETPVFWPFVTTWSNGDAFWGNDAAMHVND